MRTIEVKKRAVEQQAPCKDELDSVTACWRSSGVDSRNCLGLVTTLAACIASANIVPLRGFIGGKRVERPVNADALSARAAIDQLNRVIGKYLHRK